MLLQGLDTGCCDRRINCIIVKSSNCQMEYMSQEGYDKLVEELRYLEQVELPRVKDAISEARDKGDLSENSNTMPPSANRLVC